MQESRDASATPQVDPCVSINEKTPSRILVAEDARCIQKSMGTILSHLQMEMDMAENGLVACQMAEQSKAEGRPYDIILMDLHMPKMNGREATRQLRKHGWTGPIIAVSVPNEWEDHTDCFEAGCDDYIAKPVTRDKLEKLLDQYLNTESTAEPGHPTSSIAKPGSERSVWGAPD